MNLCKDCKHFDAHEPALQYSACQSPRNVGVISPVSGEVRRYELCSTHRQTDLDGTCGRAGRWFEARETNQVPA